jgi:putative serine protease PepD
MPTKPPPLWAGREAEPHEPDHQWLSSPPPRRPRANARATPDGDEHARAAERDRTGARRARRAAVAAACAAVVASGVAAVSLVDGDGDRQSAAPTPLPATGGRVADSRVNRIYAAVQKGVVQVRSGAGSGTGFVIDGDGSIVTNAHVVEGTSQVSVRFDDSGRSVRADVRGTDQSSDLAVLRVDPGDVGTSLKPLPLGDSDKVQVGDLAVAIGYPLGLDRTATAGIVSGLGREIRAPNGFSIDKVIQTDAPINPGNSGGPLLDARGRVIGVNSQIATAGSRGNVGIGFAVPSNTVRQVVPQLERGQRVRRPYLGVSTGPAATGAAGAVVREVRPGSPAARAGLRASSAPDGAGGDVIVSVDGKPVRRPDDVAAAIGDRAPGDRVEIEVSRDGVKRTVTVELADRPERTP